MTAKPKDHGEAEVQQNKDAEDAQGFLGHKVDPTPDAHYTVAGVIAGKPTPETDAAHRADVRTQTEAGR